MLEVHMDIKKLKNFASGFKTRLVIYDDLWNWFDSKTFFLSVAKGESILKTAAGCLLGPTAVSVIDSITYAYKKMNELNLKYVDTEAVLECKELINKMIKTELSVSCSVFLHGEPGTGKTFVVDSLSSEFPDWDVTTYDLLSVLGISKDPNNGPVVMSGDCKQSIIVFDEIDKEINEDNVSLFLKKIDCLRKQSLTKRNTKVLIIMTSNKTPKEMPKALIRPGRVSKFIEVKHWTEREAREFSRLYEIPFENLTKSSNGKYLAGQLFEDAQAYILSKL